MGDGARYLQKYQVIPTPSGKSEGAIIIDSVSGGTPPYEISVSKQGESSFQSKSFNLYNLSEGVYELRILDALGMRNTNDIEIGLSAYTLPTYSAAVTNTACTTDSNKYCDITIYSAATNWESHEAILKSAYYYNLYKNGKVVRSMRVNSGDTTQTFSGLTNGEYYLQVVDAVPNTEYYDSGQNFADACCSGVNATYSANTFFSAITSAYTINAYFYPGRFWPGWTWSPFPPTTYYTGLYKDGITNTREDMWFFTGNSTTGILDQVEYTNSNPNSARTNTDRLWYLGVTGQTMLPGEDKGPTGHTDQGQGGEDLSGGTITGQDYIGTFFYNPYVEKFIMWGYNSGATGFGWMTVNPTHKNYDIIPLVGSKNAAGVSLPNPVSADNVTSIATVRDARVGRGMFQYSGVGSQDFYSVKNWDTYDVAGWSDISNDLNSQHDTGNPALLLVKNDYKQFASGTSQSMLSPCEYLDYTWEITYGSSGTTHNTGGIILAAKTDDEGLYGEKGVTHQLSLEFYRTSGMTVYYNRAQNGYAFQRPLYGLSDDGCDDSLTHDYITKDPTKPTTSLDVVSDLNTEYVGLIRPRPTVVGKKIDEVSYTTNDTTTDSCTDSAYREFEDKVLGVDGPYNVGNTMSSQGYIRIKVTRSGRLGEDFKIEVTRTMGNKGGAQANASKGPGDPNPYYLTMEFSLIDSSTWTGAKYSAPSWVTGNELLKFLGGVKIGYTCDTYQSTWFHPEFTGSCSTISLPSDEDPGSGTNLGSQSGVTLTNASTNHVVTTKDTCNFDPKCTPKTPQIKPRMQGYFQTFRKPNTFVSGSSKDLNSLKDLKIYNLSGDTSAKFNFVFTGETSDITLKRLYPQLNIHRYEPQQKRFALVPDYKYLIDNLDTISGVTYDDFYGIITYGATSIDYSASTYIPFSALSTGTCYEYIVKPNFISKDKTTTDPVWVEIDQNLDEVKFTSEDSYFVLTTPPPKPQLKIDGLDYGTNDSCRLVQQGYTVRGIPGFESNSAFTYSAITLNFEPTSRILVTANGVLLKQSDNNLFAQLSGDTQSGDYIILNNRIYFAPKSVQNNDIVSVVYPATKGKSYHNQNFTVGAVGTSSGATLYRNSLYYFINLEYEAVGEVAIAINGTILTQGIDYTRVGEKLIQLIKPLYTDTNNLNSTDVINLYYLTPYMVVSNASVKTPQLVVQYDKTLNHQEEVELNVRDMSGNTVQTLTKKMKLQDYGTKAFTFTIEVPHPGTYTYNVISKREYPLLIGKTFTQNNSTRNIKFVMDSTVFYSPYNLPRSATGSSVTYY